MGTELSPQTISKSENYFGDHGQEQGATKEKPIKQKQKKKSPLPTSKRRRVVPKSAAAGEEEEEAVKLHYLPPSELNAAPMSGTFLHLRSSEAPSLIPERVDALRKQSNLQLQQHSRGLQELQKQSGEGGWLFRVRLTQCSYWYQDWLLGRSTVLAPRRSSRHEAPPDNPPSGGGHGSILANLPSRGLPSAFIRTETFGILAQVSDSHSQAHQRPSVGFDDIAFQYGGGPEEMDLPARDYGEPSSSAPRRLRLVLRRRLRVAPSITEPTNRSAHRTGLGSTGPTISLHDKLQLGNDDMPMVEGLEQARQLAASTRRPSRTATHGSFSKWLPGKDAAERSVPKEIGADSMSASLIIHNPGLSGSVASMSSSALLERLKDRAPVQDDLNLTTVWL